MNSKKIPKTDSIRELAKFWDNNELTSFDDELEEVTEQVFEREKVLEIHLSSDETMIVEGIAKSKGVAISKLLHDWIVEKAQCTQ